MCAYRWGARGGAGSKSGRPGGQKTPVICIPGLTRNASDFDDLAPKIAETGREVIAVSLRGRGESGRDRDVRNYHPLVYRDDVLACLDALEISPAIFLGTSLGAIVAMLLNEIAPMRVKAAIINDIGPELAPEGVARIAGYVGAVGDAPPGPAANIDEAAARIRAINEVAFPDGDDAFWRLFAARTFRQIADGPPKGQWELDYDPGIGRAFAEAPAPPDLWPGFERLKETPTLIIRGAISDLLTPPIVEQMREVHPNFQYCEVPRVGHAPTLSEPAAWSALSEFLQAIN